MCLLNNLKIKQRLFSFLNIENGPSMSDKSKTIVLVRFIFPTKMCSKVYLSIRKGFGTTSKPVNVMFGVMSIIVIYRPSLRITKLSSHFFRTQSFKSEFGLSEPTVEFTSPDSNLTADEVFHEIIHSQE